jgi:hypothetical protein
MDPTRVVLDCDTANEVDDQFAIAHALGLPEGTFEVRGVVCVHNTAAHGPGSRDMYQKEAERVVALCESDVPCIPGAERLAESREVLVPSVGLEFPLEGARLGPADPYSQGTGDERGLAAPGGPRVAGERARRLARRFRERGQSYTSWPKRTGTSTAGPTSRPGARSSKNPWASCTSRRGQHPPRYR